MTKAELIDNVARKVDGLTRSQVDVLVSTVFTSIKDALADGDKVEIRGFGSFRLRHRAAREGRNPKSGEVVRVPAKMVPFFKAGKELKEMVDH
jgi:integration host factor subunit beta